MAYYHSPQISLNGLVMALDAANQQSFRGIPTTNLLADSGMSTYNNVGGDVISNLAPTTETYKGAVVWKQTLTAISANGVSWLSNGNNPGIGVVTGGGGGLANRYTGHSIFFKPTVAMHSAPIFTCYSNIGGWQSCGNYDDMGDGWFRANVIWFNTVDGNDGKYWAINPKQATINVPIDIYWAGPFKEDRNDSQVVSPFVNGTRGTTVATGGGWKDRSKVGNNGELVNGVGFNSSNLGGLVFDGVDDTVVTTITNFGNNTTWCAWVNRASTPNYYNMFMGRELPYFGILSDDNVIFSNIIGGNQQTVIVPLSSPNNKWFFLSFTTEFNGVTTTARIYINGILTGSNSFSGSQGGGSGTFTIGEGRSTAAWYPFNGRVSNVQIYDRTLSSQEILQNYNATKGRFGL